jgi:hypothetical protein
VRPDLVGTSLLPAAALRVPFAPAIITSTMSPVGHAECWWIRCHQHHRREPACRRSADVDPTRAEENEAAIPGEGPIGAAASVVADEVQQAEPLDEARNHKLAGGGDEPRPNMNPNRRNCWPHGGRQLSSL